MALPRFKPCLANEEEIAPLPRRMAPYWHTLEYCRRIGVQKHPLKGNCWVARVRPKAKGQYRQKRLERVDFGSVDGIDFEQTVVLAKTWFRQPEIMRAASTPYPVGVERQLKYTKCVEGFTVGDALSDYVEWKRVAAAKTTFETILHLINYHIIPRLGDLAVAELNARRLTEFMMEVLERPPRYGRQPPGPRVELSELSGEQLRKRKKTINTLLGVLRLALQMAWENGEFEEERIWRTIRRLDDST